MNRFTITKLLTFDFKKCFHLSQSILLFSQYSFLVGSRNVTFYVTQMAFEEFTLAAKTRSIVTYVQERRYVTRDKFHKVFFCL